MENKRLRYFIRLSVSIIVILSLFWLVDVQKLPKKDDVNFYLVLLVFLLALVDRVINAYKWSFLVRAAGLKIRFNKLIKIYFTSGFVGLVLPSSVGGELLKGYGLAKTTSKAIDSASSVIVGRITGLIGLTVLCICGYYFAGEVIKNTPVIKMVKNISLLGLTTIILTALLGFSLPQSYFSEQQEDGRVMSFVKNVFRSFHQYRMSIGTLSIAVILSIFIHVLRAVTVSIAGLSVGVNISFVYFLIFAPFVQIGGMVPITMGGMGVKEGIGVYLFSLVGVEGASALSMYIIVRLMAIASVGPGGWVYFRHGLTVGETRQPSHDTVVDSS